MRRLSERELNRAVLARQCLLERAEAPIPRVLERVGGIQAQYAPSMYVGLWSRMAGFARDDLTRALERRAVLQATLMRVTIHLVSRRDHWPLALAVRAARRPLWLRSRRGAPGEEEMAAAAEAIRPRLAEGPIPRAELEALLGKDVAGGVGLWVDLVRAPPSGTWERRRADLLAGAEEWIGPPEVAAEAALDHLVRRYLGAFGPATRGDIASWTGLPPTALDPALARLRLRRLLGPDGAPLLDLPRAPLPDAETPAPVRFLPTWDAALLVHCRRAGILREEDRPRIFSVRNPRSEAVFLVDGVVAGTWRHAEGRIRWDPFRRLAAADRRALEDEAEGLAALHA
ncbi:MAG: hypothetical protein QOD86_323 [Miltoncostaeaceae bacterium]|nr:hypothetical protein [Miltoncostaeaceae bacterium]